MPGKAHIATARTHRYDPPPPRWLSQALELARKRYYAVGRKQGRKLPRFSEKSVSGYLEAVSDEKMYLVGWTLVPINMMAQRSSDQPSGRRLFVGVDALDCAGFRGRGQGVLVVRATHDANQHVHPVSISHMMAAEGDLSVGAHIASEIELLGMDVMNNHSYVTIVDGGKSLINQVEQIRAQHYLT